MGWRVGPEPALRLLELSLAAHAVAATGLVPGDGHVDETLEEVTLGPGRSAPGDLEVLVRGEVLAREDQLEPSFVAHRLILAVGTGGC